jgi:sortase A
MKVSLTNSPLKPALVWVQGLLGTVGVLMLGYCAVVFVDAWVFQQLETQKLETATPAASKPAIGPDGLVGRIAISRLKISVMVMEGTDQRTLRRAAGHIPGTALPGDPGNVGISAHRDTFFRPLRHILPDDLITLDTPRGEFRYRVLSTKVVNPEDLTVLADDGNEILTLVTCYPFYFVGPAPSRFIVRAERIT